MKIMIETDVSNNQFEELKSIGLDINFPFAVDITLNYGDKVIYCNGKVQSESIYKNK